MCGRRSMGCVYYMWQLVFADIINNDKLLTYCDWPWSPDCTYIYYDRYMIVHMTGLYTRLVSYARLHVLTLVVRTLVIYRSWLYSLYWLSCYLSFQLSCFHCLCCYYTRVPFSLHTLIRSLLTILDSHVQGIGHLLILFRCSSSSYASRVVGVSPFWL